VLLVDKLPILSQQTAFKKLGEKRRLEKMSGFGIVPDLPSVYDDAAASGPLMGIRGIWRIHLVVIDHCTAIIPYLDEELVYASNLTADGSEQETVLAGSIDRPPCILPLKPRATRKQ